MGPTPIIPRICKFRSFALQRLTPCRRGKKRCKERGNLFAPTKIIGQGKPPHLAVGNATFSVCCHLNVLIIDLENHHPDGSSVWC